MDKDIILKELKFTFARSSGSGGQHVNKVSTKVDLSFDILASLGLDAIEKDTLVTKAINYINTKGEVKLSSSKSRSQLQNRKLVTLKFFDLLTETFLPVKVRKKSKPSKAKIAKRLKAKKQQAEKKNTRKKVELPKQFDLFSFKCVSFVGE